MKEASFCSGPYLVPIGRAILSSTSTSLCIHSTKSSETLRKRWLGRSLGIADQECSCSRFRCRQLDRCWRGNNVTSGKMEWLSRWGICGSSVLRIHFTGNSSGQKAGKDDDCLKWRIELEFSSLRRSLVTSLPRNYGLRSFYLHDDARVRKPTWNFSVNWRALNCRMLELNMTDLEGLAPYLYRFLPLLYIRADGQPEIVSLLSQLRRLGIHLDPHPLVLRYKMLFSNWPKAISWLLVSSP